MEEITQVNSPTTTATLLLPPLPPPPPPPSSSETSPSHEFSFTITFHSPPSTSPQHPPQAPPLPPPPSSATSAATTTTASAITATAADDDIFLRCQLLPLHHLLPPPSPPRPSDITFEHFALASLDRDDDVINKTPNRCDEVRGSKSRSLLSSFFGLANSRKKASEGKVCEAKAEAENGKKKSRGLLSVSRLLKKYYASVMEPLLFFRGDKEKEKEKEKEREKKEEVLQWRGFRRRPCSFSGDAGSKEQGKRGKHRRKTEQVLSAPNSARTSRANSGALAAAPSSVFSSSDGSTMEELQSAIQAAIAHCKSSLANSKQQGNGNLAMVKG